MGSDRAKNSTGIYGHFFTQEAVNCPLQLFGLFEIELHAFSLISLMVTMGLETSLLSNKANPDK